MKIYCKHCFENGIRGGTSVYRLTSTLRPRWTAPQDYYILSPSHDKHEGSRTTLPAWMLQGSIASLVGVLMNDDRFKSSLTGIFDSLLVSGENNDIVYRVSKLQERRTELNRMIANGVEELLQWKSNQRIKERIRTEVQNLDSEISYIESELEATSQLPGKSDRLEKTIQWVDLFRDYGIIADKKMKMGAWLEYLSPFIQSFLIDGDSMEIQFHIDLSVTISLPKIVTKSTDTFDCSLRSSTIEISNHNFPLKVVS